MAAKVAFVIGAGGIKCAAALGMWKVFQREGKQGEKAAEAQLPYLKRLLQSGM